MERFQAGQVNKKLRDYILAHGEIVGIDPEEVKYWGPEDPERHVSQYGWVDYIKTAHGHTCGWVEQTGAQLQEQSYQQFIDTFAGSEDEYGINLSPVSCKCGQYTDEIIRYKGDLTSILQAVLNS